MGCLQTFFVFVATIAASFAVAWLLWPSSAPPDHVAFVARYEDGYRLSVTLEGVDFDHACIVSAEGRRIHLDPKYACPRCEHDASAGVSVTGHYHDHLLYIKSGEKTYLRKIYNVDQGYMRRALLVFPPETLDDAAPYSLNYSALQDHWPALAAKGYEQCTIASLDTARCRPFGDSCIFLFDHPGRQGG